MIIKTLFNKDLSWNLAHKMNRIALNIWLVSSKGYIVP